MAGRGWVRGQFSRLYSRIALWGVIVTFALSPLAAPLTVAAQPPSTVPQIGILTPAAEPFPPLWEAFRQGLHSLGYVEGKNIALEYGFAAGQNERLTKLAAELWRFADQGMAV